MEIALYRKLPKYTTFFLTLLWDKRVFAWILS